LSTHEKELGDDALLLNDVEGDTTIVVIISGTFYTFYSLNSFISFKISNFAPDFSMSLTSVRHTRDCYEHIV